jgi:hypothetical protein
VAVVSLYLRRPPTAYQAPQDAQYGPLLDAANAALTLDDQKAKLQQLMALVSQNVGGVPIAYVPAAAVGTSKVHDVSMTASPLDPQHRAFLDA